MPESTPQTIIAYLFLALSGYALWVSQGPWPLVAYAALATYYTLMFVVPAIRERKALRTSK